LQNGKILGTPKILKRKRMRMRDRKLANLIKLLNTALIISLSFVSFNSQARAEDCDGTTAEMKACGQRNLDSADGKLNAFWQSLPESRKKQLIQQQRAWMKYRDSYCDAYAKSLFDAGSRDAILVRLGCLTEETKAQTQKLIDLQNLIEGKGSK
jgi:uncharacterized protein YecT (DUF1311 family)